MNYKIINKFSSVTFLMRKNPNIFSALKSLVNFMSPAWFILKKNPPESMRITSYVSFI